MVTYSCLKVLSKDELIRCILKLISRKPSLSREFQGKLIETYQEKIAQIQKMHDACNLSTPDGKINYFMLQKDYESTMAALNAQKGN